MNILSVFACYLELKYYICNQYYLKLKDMIKLDENYTVEHDTYCWTLKFKKEKEVTDEETKQTKVVVSKNESFHASLKDALKKYADQSLKIEGSVFDLISKIKDLEKLIMNLKLK